MDALKQFVKRAARGLLPQRAQVRIERARAARYLDTLPVISDSWRKAIVVLNHFFDQDVKALTLANRQYEIVPIDTVTLFRGAKLFFDEDVRELNAPYHTADPVRVEEYRRHCEFIFDRLQQRVRPSLLVTASDIFYWVREFIKVARSHGVKTVVLDKEGTLSPHDYEAESRRIREFAPFISDHIFVWSERQRRFWNKIGVDDGKISVIGQPRSDLLHQTSPHTVDAEFVKPQPLVTLFSYMDDAYIPVSLIQSEKLTWSMKRETHEHFHQLAQVNPEYNFVIKTHPQQPDLQKLRKQYQRENLRVIGGSATANELLQRSELIIAFQTTVIIEAMLLERRVIYTYWDPLIGRLQDDLLPFHCAGGIVIARTFEQHKETCQRFFAGDHSDFTFSPTDRQERDRFVNEYLYRPDGHVCDRFCESVERFMP